MPHKPMLLLRVAVTLSCLVGVPTVALVGIRHADSTAPRHRPIVAGPTDSTEVVAGQEGERLRREPAHTRRAVEVPTVGGPIAASAAIGEADVDAPRGPRTTEIDAAGYEAPLPATADLLAQQLARLQQLGATYYRLESSPRAAAEFRFHCRVAGFERAFEAVDATAAGAVGRVARDVEAALRDSTSKAAAKQPASVYLR